MASSIHRRLYVIALAGVLAGTWPATADDLAKEAEKFHLALNSPPDTKATVCIPLAELGHQAVRVRDTTVWLNGKPAGKVPGLSVGKEQAGYATFIVDPGEWKFEAR